MQLLWYCLSLCIVVSLTLQSFAYAQFEAEDLVIAVKDIKILKLKNSDVVQVKLNVLNNGNEKVAFLQQNFGLFDSELREYESTSSYELEERGESVPRGVCDILFGEGANPGLSVALEICFDVPKTNFQYDSLIVYENMFIRTPDQAKIIPLVDNSIGYQAFVEKAQLEDEKLSIRAAEIESKGGCLIATATYGSELAPQVQLLREIRDNKVLKTDTGLSFMTSFNEFYYSFSPTVADWERQNPLFRETVKVVITPLLLSLSLIQYVDIDSELEMLVYGVGIIIFNVGMYFVIPAVIIRRIVK